MGDFKLDIKVKTFLILIISLPFIGLFGWLFWEALTDKNTHKQLYLEFEEKVSFMGKVDSIYRLKMSHNTLTLEAGTKNFFVPSKWEDKFLIGDSISKKRGEPFLEHYRGGELIEVLDYRDLAKEMKDDDWDIIWRRLKRK